MAIKIFGTVLVAVVSFMGLKFASFLIAFEPQGYNVSTQILNLVDTYRMGICIILLSFAIVLVWRNKLWWGVGISFLVLPINYIGGWFLIELMKN